jgi:hypothetical protein
MALASPVPPLDGRSARALRTREAIVDACIGLVEEGELRPTAPRVAERAGVLAEVGRIVAAWILAVPDSTPGAG